MSVFWNRLPPHLCETIRPQVLVMNHVKWRLIDIIFIVHWLYWVSPSSSSQPVLTPKYRPGHFRLIAETSFHSKMSKMPSAHATYSHNFHCLKLLTQEKNCIFGIYPLIKLKRFARANYNKMNRNKTRMDDLIIFEVVVPK